MAEKKNQLQSEEEGLAASNGQIAAAEARYAAEIAALSNNSANGSGESNSNNGGSGTISGSGFI